MNDETPDVPDEAENQTTVEEDLEKDVEAKPEGGRIS